MRIPILTNIIEARQRERQANLDFIAAETEMIQERTTAIREMKKQSLKTAEAIVKAGASPKMTMNEGLYGGSTGYTNEMWSQNNAGARRLARIAHAQSPAAQALIGRFTHLVYGPRLDLQATPLFDIIPGAPQDTETQQKIIKNIETRYKLWARSPRSDYTGNMSHYKRSRMNFEKLLSDGEYFVILRYRQTKKRNPLTIQYIKPENVQRVDSKVLPGNIEENGIEYDSQDRAIAYHILDSKTGRSTRVPRYGTRTGRTLVIHNKINGEKRGVSLLAGIITELTKLSDLQALEIQAAVINALFAVWVETPVGGENKTFVKKQGISGIDGESAESRRNQFSTADFEAKLNRTDFNHGGIVAEGLGEGQKLHSFDTKRPTANFESFFNEVKKNIYAAKGMARSVADYDFDASYSAARGELLVLWLNIMTMRFDHATDYESVIYQMWLWGEIDNNNVPDFGYSDEFIREAFSYALFTGPVRPDIDPMKSAKAHEVEHENAWKTNQQIAAERGGGDWDENIKRKLSENQQLAEANEPLMRIEKTSYSFSENRSKTESKTVEE